MIDENIMKKVTRLVFFILILILVFLVIRNSGIEFQDLTPLKIKNYLLSYGIVKASVIYVVIYTLSIRPFVPVPPTLYTIVGGFTFGPVLGTLLTVAGATFNASISFMIARLMGKNYVERLLKGRLRRVNEKLTDSGFKTLLIIRSSPVGPPFDLVSYASGVLKIPFRSHFLATLIGIIPATAVYSYFGGSITKGGFFIILGFFLIVIFSVLIPWLLRRRRAADKQL